MALIIFPSIIHFRTLIIYRDIILYYIIFFLKGKRNTSHAGMEEELRVKEKRIKLDEEARQLGVLLESKFRSAEVAEQPRRVQ